MNSDIVKRVQAIAVELGARGTQPGFVAGGTKERVAKLNSELVAMFNDEQDVSTTKRQKRVVDKIAKNPVTGNDEPVYKLVETDEVLTQRQATPKGNILRAMIQHLAVAGGANCYSKDEHERKIVAAGIALPELCEKLQALTSLNETENKGIKTRQGRMSKDVANENLKQLLEIDPKKYMEMGQVELAEAVGCSRGTLGKTSAYRIEIPKLKRKRR